MANIDEITRKLAAIAVQQKDVIKEFFRRNDPQSTGLIDYDQFRYILY